MANYNPYFQYVPFYNSAQLPYQQQQPLSDQPPQWHQETALSTASRSEESCDQAQPQTSKGKSASRERWQFKDEQLLIQLWADNINKLESKDSRKVWEQIARTLNEKAGVNKTVDQCQRKMKHLKNQYKDKKDWNRRQSGGNLRKSPHYDAIDEVLGCRDTITCKNVQQLGIVSEATPPEVSADSISDSAADGPSTPSPSASSSTSSTESTKRRERKKTRRPMKRAYDGDSDPEETFKETMKSLSAEGQQMSRVMEGMQQSQAQQLQLMTQLLGSFNRYMDSKQAKKD